MDFTSSQYAQLIVAALAGIAYFVLLFRLSERTSLAFVLLLIPFQLIDSKYGTINTILVYVMAFAFLLQGRLNRLPFLTPVLLILFAYLLAFSQGHPAARMQHVLYLFGFLSNVLLFYLVYNFLLRTKDWEFVFRLLIILNVLVLIYCAIQFVAGHNRVTLFGIEELSMNPIRRDGRLVGPFKATAATAEFLSIQCILLGHYFFHATSRSIRRWIALFLALNVLFIFTTGNRGGFITLVLGALLLIAVYRRRLGFARIAKMLLGGATVVTMIAIVLVNYSDYGMLFGRLERTKIEGGVPDTRATVWPIAWERIQEKPVFGHGPKLFISTPDNMVADIPYMLHPHSLPLHILYTTGAAGLFAWGVFFWLLFRKLLVARRARSTDGPLSMLPRVGLVVLAVFGVSQLRIEFLREGLLDYQNYLFVLFALLLAVCDLVFQQASRDHDDEAKTKSRWA